MTNALFDIKKTGRAALAAILISATALPAVPAQARSSGNSMPFANGFTLQLEGQGRAQAQGQQGMQTFEQQRQRRLSNRQIRRALRSYGFHDIYFGRERRQRVKVFATWGPWEYSMRIHRRTGKVTRVRRIRFVGGVSWFLRFNGRGGYNNW